MIDTINHAYSPGAGHTGLCTECNNVELHAYHMPAPARETVVSTAETDPAAIDLDVIRRRSAPTVHAPGAYDINRLITEVEVLRERVVRLEQYLGSMRASRDHANFKTEASEAQVVELAGALENFKKHLSNVYQEDDWEADCLHMMDDMAAVLARLPADALERARLRQDIIDIAREIVSTESAWTSEWVAKDKLLHDLFVRLNTLDQENGT